MKKIVIIAFILIVNLNGQTLKLTLEESLQLGLKNSKELKISNSKIDYFDAKLSEVNAQMLPKLSLNGGYLRNSDVDPFEVNLPILPNPIVLQETILDNYNLRATIEQPIFTGFKLTSLKRIAQINKKIGVVELSKEKILKIDNITKSFWKYYTSQQIVILLEKSLKALNKHLKDTEIFLKNGLVTKNDLLKLKVKIADAELRLITAENNEQIACAHFNKKIGLPLNSSTLLIVENINNPKVSFDFKELITEALSKRSEIKSTELLISALEKKEDIAKSEYYPQLFAFSNFHYSNPNKRFMPLENKFNDSWDVGVSLKWDLWNWGGTSSKTEQVEQEQYQAENNFKLLKENIELEVYNNYLSLLTTIKKIELSKVQVEASNENYRITNEKYNQQLASSTDLIDAETSKLNAATNLINSSIEYKINLSSLNKSLGRNYLDSKGK